jgi:hypothetical protein
MPADAGDSVTAFVPGLDRIGSTLLEPLTAPALERLGRIAETLDRYRHLLDPNAILLAEAARHHPALYDLVERHFAQLDPTGGRFSLMRRTLDAGDLVIPVVGLWTGSEVKLGRLDSDPIHVETGWESSPYVLSERRVRSGFSDDVVFTARRISPAPNGVEIAGGLTRYGSVIASQDALERELLHALAARFSADPGTDIDWSRLDLVRRRAIERESPEFLLDGSIRANALAVATLIVHATPRDGYRIEFGVRSDQSGSHAGLCHVIPSGMLQPEFGDPETEWSVYHGFLKEYGEELFGETIQPGAGRADDFYSEWPAVSSLLRAIDAGRSEFHVTGLVVNALNLRPEICTLLLVRDAAWWERQAGRMRSNWEHARPAGSGSTMLRSLSLDRAETDFAASFGASPDMWVPSGLAALWLGVDAARKAVS